MTQLQWDAVGDRLFETGIDKGVLYIPTAGVYDLGVAWNGLTGVTESPSGAEANPLYADNIKYLNLISIEQFGGTITAYTYPDEFAECDGSVELATGVSIGQQNRKTFGLAYRSRLGNDEDGDAHGYKLHLIYGAIAAPSEKAYATVNDSPEAIEFSWEFNTTPVDVPGHRPSSSLVIDSTKVNPSDLADLELILYGSVGVDPALPLPAAVAAIFNTVQTVVTPAAPTFTSSTGAIVIPTVTGVQYRRADTNAVVTGTVTIGTPGGHLVITANPASSSYIFSSWADDDWSFTRDP